ncbi:MAG TPA: hypothetical protein VNN77_16310 [candidate division Zixibacteria bacterium]|nr:hypothetical protein [candidate division Zixibacteria bacterium]
MKRAVSLLGSLMLGLLALGGCHELGHVGGPGSYGGSQDEIAGEIAHIDSRAREIEILADDGRPRRVRYDGQTRVVYRQREYAVSNLEPGDYVAVRTATDRQGRLYADSIMVRESVQERGGGRAGRFDRLEGTVEYVDQRRGSFELRDRRDRLVFVSLPFNAPRAARERFNRLRPGDFVRLEGRFVDQNRFELESFV